MPSRHEQAGLSYQSPPHVGATSSTGYVGVKYVGLF
jgi:hypothetical protein